MGKDPAILFYFDHWRGGTMTLTRFLKGCYIDLLDAQFNSGHLALEEIRIFLGSDFGTSWPILQKKFVQDENGLFFNVRLDTEILKRKAFSEKQKANGKKGGRKPNSNPTLIPTESLLVDINIDGNINKDLNKNKEEGMGETKLPDYAQAGLLADFEAWAKENFYHVDVILSKTGVDKDFALERLHLFHLELLESNRYLIDKKAALAGFEKYLIHSSNKKKINGTSKTKHRRSDTIIDNSKKFGQL